jgi:hypothetical protein
MQRMSQRLDMPVHEMINVGKSRYGAGEQVNSWEQHLCMQSVQTGLCTFTPTRMSDQTTSFCSQWRCSCAICHGAIYMPGPISGKAWEMTQELMGSRQRHQTLIHVICILDIINILSTPWKNLGHIGQSSDSESWVALERVVTIRILRCSHTANLTVLSPYDQISRSSWRPRINLFAIRSAVTVMTRLERGFPTWISGMYPLVGVSYYCFYQLESSMMEVIGWKWSTSATECHCCFFLWDNKSCSLDPSLTSRRYVYILHLMIQNIEPDVTFTDCRSGLQMFMLVSQQYLQHRIVALTRLLISHLTWFCDSVVDLW